MLTVVETRDLGARWRSKDSTNTYHLTDMLEDIRLEKSKHQITLDVLRAAANTTTPFLSFTGEVAVRDKGISVLDTMVWMGCFPWGPKMVPWQPKAWTRR